MVWIFELGGFGSEEDALTLRCGQWRSSNNISLTLIAPSFQHHHFSARPYIFIMVGIFIIYLTACANDFARENKRQTITANDVLAAIKVCYVQKQQPVKKES